MIDEVIPPPLNMGMNKFLPHCCGGSYFCAFACCSTGGVLQPSSEAVSNIHGLQLSQLIVHIRIAFSVHGPVVLFVSFIIVLAHPRCGVVLVRSAVQAPGLALLFLDLFGCLLIWTSNSPGSLVLWSVPLVPS